MSAHRSSPASRLAVCSALVGCWARCSAAAELPPAAGVARRYPRRSVSGHLGEATMADGYGDILGGFDPYAGQRLAAAMAATLGADPGRLAYSAGPVGQALGQISGGFERARAIDLANTLAGERMAALPDLASAYTATDPYQWAAQKPQASPLARAMILGTSPMDVTKTREAAINAAMAGLNLRGFASLQGGAGTPAAAPRRSAGSTPTIPPAGPTAARPISTR